MTESTVQTPALAWLENVGWCLAHGPDIAPHTAAAGRADLSEVVLAKRLSDTLLSKLIPGELRLKDAERIVGVAT